MPDKKKALYLMTFTPLWASVAEQMLKKHSVEPALYVGLEREQLQGSLFDGKKVPFYDVNEARRAISPYHIEGFQQRSLDPELIESFSSHQAILHEMTSRFTLGKKDGSFLWRRQYIWQLIRIWEGLFDSLEFDVVFAASMPHRVFDYLVYLICEKRNIPFLALETTSIGNLTYACSSVHDQSQIFDDKNFKDVKLAPLSKQTTEYFEYVRAAKDNYKPFNISLSGLFQSHDHLQENNQNEKVDVNKNDQSANENNKDSSQSASFAQKSKTSLKNIKDSLFKFLKLNLHSLPQPLSIIALFLKQLCMGRLKDPIETTFTFFADDDFKNSPTRKAVNWQYLVLSWKTMINVKKAERWYTKNKKEPDLTKPYIYFPANFMPERSTVPDSGYFYDYFLIFSMLERAIPKDWQIIFKEHPRSFYKPIDRDNPRDIDFYIRLQEASSRIVFIDPHTDSKELIKNCEAVAIASGTTGWEAIARGKPVLLFGEYWYGKCKGVFRIHALSELKSAIKSILNSPIVEKEDVLEYLRKVESVSQDFRYYFLDNVAERGNINKKRTFTQKEQEFREEFIEKMSDYLALYSKKSNEKKHKSSKLKAI